MDAHSVQRDYKYERWFIRLKFRRITFDRIKFEYEREWGKSSILLKEQKKFE